MKWFSDFHFLAFSGFERAGLILGPAFPFGLKPGGFWDCFTLRFRGLLASIVETRISCPGLFSSSNPLPNLRHPLSALPSDPQLGWRLLLLVDYSLRICKIVFRLKAFFAVCLQSVFHSPF